MDECSRPHKGRGHFNLHYQRWRSSNGPGVAFCAVMQSADRERFGGGRGYCHLHYTRLRRGKNGLDGRKVRGSLQNGYRIFWVNGKRVPEHRLVMEQILGRPLRPRRKRASQEWHP